MSDPLNQPAPTREWRRKRYRRTRRDWITSAGLFLLLVVTALVVAVAFGR